MLEFLFICTLYEAILSNFLKFHLNSSTILVFLNTVTMETKSAGVLISITWCIVDEEAWNQTSGRKFFQHQFMKVGVCVGAESIGSRLYETPDALRIWNFEALFWLVRNETWLCRIIPKGGNLMLAMWIEEVGMCINGDHPFQLKVRGFLNLFHRSYRHQGIDFVLLKLLLRCWPLGSFSFVQSIFLFRGVDFWSASFIYDLEGRWTFPFCLRPS